MEIEHALKLGYEVASNFTHNARLYNNALFNGIIKENANLYALIKNLDYTKGAGYENYYIYCSYFTDTFYYKLCYTYKYNDYEIVLSEADIQELYKLL